MALLFWSNSQHVEASPKHQSLEKAPTECLSLLCRIKRNPKTVIWYGSVKMNRACTHFWNLTVRTSSMFLCSLAPLTPPVSWSLSGLVPEPEDEGQTPATLPAVAAPPRRPARGAPDEPCFDSFRPTVPLHPAPPPAPPPPSSLSTGSALASLLSASRSLRSTHEDPGRDPPLPLP